MKKQKTLDTESLLVEKSLGESPSSVNAKELEWEFLDWDFWVLGALGSVEITLCHCGTWIYFSPLVIVMSLYSPMMTKTIFQVEKRLIFRHLIDISGSSLRDELL